MKDVGQDEKAQFPENDFDPYILEVRIFSKNDLVNSEHEIKLKNLIQLKSNVSL